MPETENEAKWRTEFDQAGEAESVPSSFAVGDDIDWDAPWADVNLWVELPFWLMVDNGAVTLEYQGCVFSISIHDNYFELHCDGISDARETVLYQGPFKPREQLSDNIKRLLEENPRLSVLWRKCKTTLKIKSRCNAAVLARTDRRPRSYSLYLAELCRAHIPVVNRLIQSYRLATYDYFAFEVSPWDVPRWLVERDEECCSCTLVPYREWDAKPIIYSKPKEHPVQYQLTTCLELSAALSAPNTPGEFELLDALNLMERGDYSGAVRRITSAIEVVVEAVVKREIYVVDGTAAAADFIQKTRNNFPLRLAKYEELSRRKLSDVLHDELRETRRLRHRIVHEAYRISPGEHGHAQRSVDTGRWIFNWLENDPSRFDVREKRIALRSLGRDVMFGVFPTEITPAGVVVSPVPVEI